MKKEAIGSSKEGQVGDMIGSGLGTIPTVREKFTFVEPVHVVELPSKIKVYDTRRIMVSKVELTSREDVLRINGDGPEGFDYRIDRKKSYMETGEPIRDEKDAEKLTVKSLTEEIDKCEDIEKKAQETKAMLIAARDHIKEYGLEYDEKGNRITINIMKK